MLHIGAQVLWKADPWAVLTVWWVDGEEAGVRRDSWARRVRLEELEEVPHGLCLAPGR